MMLRAVWEGCSSQISNWTTRVTSDDYIVLKPKSRGHFWPMGKW